jgi:5-methylcytosine-specific restriction endonuclease McrA
MGHVHRPLFSINEIRRRVLIGLGTTTPSTWRRALEVFDHKCAYCGVGGQKLQRDHVLPLSRGGYDIPANVVPACHTCNTSKGAQGVRYWMTSRGMNYQWFVFRWMTLRRKL